MRTPTYSNKHPVSTGCHAPPAHHARQPVDQVPPMPYVPLAQPARITEHDWPPDTQPVVSIWCITYNHVDFIRDAVEGFLMQETTFPVEILIHDDASTDGTSEIVRDYQRRYPQLIRAKIQGENQWSQGKTGQLEFMASAAGEFIAWCEGDDFWTSAQKLETQVHFMRANGACAFCHHDARILRCGTEYNVPIEEQFHEISPTPFLGFTEFATSPSVHTGSVVMINDPVAFAPIMRNVLPRFAHTFFYVLLIDGRQAGFLPQVMSVYRVHQGGVYSTAGLERQRILGNRNLLACWRYFADPEHRRIFSCRLADSYTTLAVYYIRKCKLALALKSYGLVLRYILLPPNPVAIRKCITTHLRYMCHLLVKLYKSLRRLGNCICNRISTMQKSWNQR